MIQNAFGHLEAFEVNIVQLSALHREAPSQHCVRQSRYVDTVCYIQVLRSSPVREITPKEIYNRLRPVALLTQSSSYDFLIPNMLLYLFI